MQYQPQSSGRAVPNMEKLFHYRSCIYKLGLIVFLGSFAFFLLGFSTSHWIKFPMPGISLGLWNLPCSYELSLCNRELLVTRALFIAYLAAYIVSMGLAIYENARLVDRNTYHSRKLELALAITGSLGVVALSVFAFVWARDFHRGSFGWSMSVTVLALVGLFVAFLTLLCGNAKPTSPPGIVLNRNAPQQAVVFQTAGPLPPATHSQMYTAPLNPYPVMNAYPPPAYPPQSQPLLPQPYPQPVPEAPPPYHLPPAYPPQSFPPQAQNMEQAAGMQYEGYAKASAPPMD